MFIAIYSDVEFELSAGVLDLRVGNKDLTYGVRKPDCNRLRFADAASVIVEFC